ncbi:MAG: transglycosylase SLT domain-containing protein [Patescibacteria group bacterium]
MADSQSAAVIMSVAEIELPTAESLVQVVSDKVAKYQREALEALISDLSIKYETDVDLALAIAQCESHTTHYNDQGKILRGRIDRDDLGVFQINERFHGKKSKELGFDIYDPEGNVAYALWMLKNTGSHPWKASRSCWTKHLALAK